jgi:hypothetical protein
MSQIVLDEQQAKILTQADEQVEIRDPAGHLLGYASPITTAADIAEARRALASPGPRYTTEQVLQYLESLNRK